MLIFTNLLAQSADDGAAAAAAVAGMGMLQMVFSVAMYLVIAFSLYTIANKKGVENSWFAFIPILNLYLMTQVAGKDWWWMLLMLIPCANIVVFIILCMGIAEAAGKPSWWGILMGLPCVNLIAWPMVAFGK